MGMDLNFRESRRFKRINMYACRAENKTTEEIQKCYDQLKDVTNKCKQRGRSQTSLTGNHSHYSYNANYDFSSSTKPKNSYVAPHLTDTAATHYYTKMPLYIKNHPTGCDHKDLDNNTRTITYYTIRLDKYSQHSTIPSRNQGDNDNGVNAIWRELSTNSTYIETHTHILPQPWINTGAY